MSHKFVEQLLWCFFCGEIDTGPHFVTSFLRLNFCQHKFFFFYNKNHKQMLRLEKKAFTHKLLM